MGLWPYRIQECAAHQLEIVGLIGVTAGFPWNAGAVFSTSPVEHGLRTGLYYGPAETQCCTYLNYVFLMQDDIVRVLRLRGRHRLMAMSISHIVYMSRNLEFPLSTQ